MIRALLSLLERAVVAVFAEPAPLRFESEWPRSNVSVLPSPDEPELFTDEAYHRLTCDESFQSWLRSGGVS